MRLNSVGVGDIFIAPEARTSIIAILDTGTSLILAPLEELQFIRKFIGTAGMCWGLENGWWCDCAQFPQDEYPDIIIEISGYYFSIPSSLYFYKYSEFCLLLISSVEQKNFWVLGDVFMRSYYTIFDMKNNLIGLSE